MKSGDPLIFLAAVIIGAIAIAFPLAIFLNRLDRWWKFRKILQAMERTPNMEIADGFKLHEVRRPPNVIVMKRSPREAA